MTNSNRQNGFYPVLNSDGSVYTGQGRKYYKSATSGPIAVGDVVVRKTGSIDPLGGPEIIKYTVGSYMTGVVVSVDPDVTNITKVPGVLLAADLGYVYVEDDPAVIFEVQEGGTGTALAITDVGKHINSLTAADADATIGRSVDGIDNNAKATNNSFIIVRLAPNTGNNVGLYAKWWVKANLHTEVNAGATNVKEI